MPFYFWTVILGMIIGAAVTWFLVADHPFESREAPGGPVDDLEVGVLAAQLKAEGTELSESVITRVLELHGAYVVGEPTASALEASAAETETEPGATHA